QDGVRVASMDGVGEQLASHRTAPEARGGQATCDIEVATLRDLANERRPVQRERHQTSPGPGDGERVQQRQHFRGMLVIHLNTGGVWYGIIADELTISPKNNLTIARLTAIEMAGKSDAAVMGQ